MRLTVSEKQEIIMLVERSELGVNRTLLQLGINKSTFYKWYNAYLDKGIIGLEPKYGNRQRWNTIPQAEIQITEKNQKIYIDSFPR